MEICSDVRGARNESFLCALMKTREIRLNCLLCLDREREHYTLKLKPYVLKLNWSSRDFII